MGRISAMENRSFSGANLVFARCDMMVTMRAAGATGGRPRESLNYGHRTKWRGFFLPHP